MLGHAREFEQHVLGLEVARNARLLYSNQIVHRNKDHPRSNNCRHKATKLITNVASKNMPIDLPKTYKVGVFKEAGKPLTFEERELKLPGDGEVRHGNTPVYHSTDPNP